MRARGLTLVELLVALALAAAVTAAVLRVTVASGRQQQALLQGGALQAELRRGLGVAQQVLAEGGFLLPLRGGPLGLEFLQAVAHSDFTVLGVGADGLVVRLLDAGYDPRALRRAVVVDAGGNGYVYSLSAARALDAASGLWSLEGTACARPGLPARGVGAALARLGSGAALASFGAAGVEATGLYFQREGEAPELLLGEAGVRLRYAYRAADGEVLVDDAPHPARAAGGKAYRLAALGVELERAVGQGLQAATRRLSGDVLLEEAGLGLRGLDCGPAPEALPVGGGEWRVEIAGLDTGVAASVGVSGPGGYAATLTASATLSGLAQGTYRLQAAAVVHPAFPSTRYRPVQPPEGSALSVAVGGGTRPLTRVTYQRLGGRLRWEVAGLPGGLAAEVEADGPFASYRYSAAAGAREEAAEPGPYTLRFAEVRAPDGSGVWRPDPPSLRAEVPSEGVGEAGTVRYRFERYPGMLELDVRFEGGAPGVNPQVCVYPSDGSAVDPNAQVYGCP